VGTYEQDQFLLDGTPMLTWQLHWVVGWGPAATGVPCRPWSRAARYGGAVRPCVRGGVRYGELGVLPFSRVNTALAAGVVTALVSDTGDQDQGR
jgi:hypothetical protein